MAKGKKKEPILLSGKPLCESGAVEFGLTEALAEARIDVEAGIIHGVKVASKTSKNNRDYTEALNDIASLAEGTPSYLNHGGFAEYSEMEGIRDVKGLAGMFRSGRVEGDSVIADFHIAPEVKEKVVWIAKNKPRGVGFSLVSPFGQYEIEEGKGAQPDRVKRIHALESIDLVSQAAMASSLFEHEDKKGCEAMEVKTLQELKEHYGALLQEALAPVEQERDALKAEVDALKAKDAAREAAVKQLKSTKAIESASKIFDVADALSDVKDDAKRGVLIEAYAASLKKAEAIPTVPLTEPEKLEEKAKKEKEDADFAAVGL